MFNKIDFNEIDFNQSEKEKETKSYYKTSIKSSFTSVIASIDLYNFVIYSSPLTEDSKIECSKLLINFLREISNDMESKLLEIKKNIN
jgi:hypothetical protein